MLTDRLPGFSMLLKLTLRSQHFGNTSDEGKSLTLEEFLGALRVMQFPQSRFVVKQF